ncbi:MAG: hypothetical protein NZ742_10825 [Acidobacteria bacterium]|nr:hypothetical protein [Acidobacteriota bacterium]MDW7985194.1 hypothetical protein [Acidobacteriota bacterium]
MSRQGRSLWAIGWALGVFCVLARWAGASTLEVFLQAATQNPSEAYLTRWLDQHGWPTVHVGGLIRLLRSPVPTGLILQMAERSAQTPDASGILRVEGTSVWLKGDMRLAIIERDGQRTWMITNRTPTGERIGGPLPRPTTATIEIPREIRIVHEYPEAPEPRPRRRYEAVPTPSETSTPTSKAPIYLFPNPLFWQLTCALQGIQCEVVRPVPPQPIPPSVTTIPAFVQTTPPGPIPPVQVPVTPAPGVQGPAVRFQPVTPQPLAPAFRPSVPTPTWRFRVPPKPTFSSRPSARPR